MDNTITRRNKNDVEKRLAVLLDEYRFSRTELSSIVNIAVDVIREGAESFSMKQEDTITNFYMHMGVFNKILNHQDRSMTADWFFANIDDEVICSPFDMYAQHSFSAVRDMLQDVDQVAHIRKFYPEYVKTHQEIVPVVMGDGTVRLVVKA